MRNLKVLPTSAEFTPAGVDMPQPLDKLTLREDLAGMERIHSIALPDGSHTAGLGQGSHATLKRAGRP